MIPSTVELGGKSPNIFFADIMLQEDEYLSKCIEGAVSAFFNQGEVCTCPSRLLVQESIYEVFISKIIERTKSIKRGNPLDTNTMIGAQVSKLQYDKILNYVKVGREEGAEVLIGGAVSNVEVELSNGFYIEPTIMKGTNDMKIFQEEIFGNYFLFVVT